MTPAPKSARTHIYAWYTYAFAAEVFSACALAIFLPITLEQMAREVGFVAPDLLVPCSQMGSAEGEEKWVCKARILGSWVDTASFSMYVKSLAVAIQALAIISIGPLADSPQWRKKLLIVFAYTGALSGIALLLFPPRPEAWIPVAAAGLTIIGNVGYATSIVCANAFLPGLAREDPDVVAAAIAARVDIGQRSRQGGHEASVPGGAGLEDEEAGEPRIDTVGEGEGETLLPHALVPAITSISPADLARADPDTDTDVKGHENHYQALLSLTTSRISSTGTGLGFFSGVAVLALLMVPVTLGQGSTASLRLAIGLSGVWWAAFTVPAAIGLPSGKEGTEAARDESGQGRLLTTAWKRVGRMIAPREMRRLPNLFTLLLAWIFLSDGFHTTTYTAILYASTTLRMPPSKIIIIGILVQLAAVVSSIYTPRLQRRLGHTNIAILLRIVILALILPIYTCIGLLLPFGGLRTEGEMYVAATWFGLLYGPFNSYSRAVYAELIPPGHESSFFSLFALTDKSASFLGPFVVGLIADITGNIRLGFLFLLAMLLIPVPVLLRVNIPRGREEANLWSRS